MTAASVSDLLAPFMSHCCRGQARNDLTAGAVIDSATVAAAVDAVVEMM